MKKIIFMINYEKCPPKLQNSWELVGMKIRSSDKIKLILQTIALGKLNS